jgi:hypothetical protein
MTPASPPGPERPPARPTPAWRRPAVLLAVALDAAVVIATVWALLNGFEPIVVAFAAILGIAPWAAIIDETERPRRR